MAKTHAGKAPVLIGVSGHVAGEVFLLRPGESITVGRSRSCTISLRQLKSWIQLSEEDREKDEDFLTVGSRHFRLTIHKSLSATVENLSRSGTRVDGKIVEREIHIPDLGDQTHTIEFGILEKFELLLEAPRTSA